MKKLFSWAVIFLLTLLFPVKAFAIETPSFPSCPTPGGEVLASYSDGIHGIAGESSQSGRDNVYQVSQNTVVQCFCANNNGIQTNWWKINSLTIEQIQTLEKLGWVHIPDGSAWGLEETDYMAQNIHRACNSNNNDNNNGGGGSGGGSSSAPTCSAAKPSTPILLNVERNGASAKLTWTSVTPASYYTIGYGLQPGVYPFGVPNTGNVTSYTINNLDADTLYYFAVRAVNDCTPGDWATISYGGFVSGLSLGILPNVLGESTPSADPIDPPQVFGETVDLGACVRCFWFPILAVLVVVLALYYFLMRNRPFTKWRWILGGLAALIAYIVFLLWNLDCIDGVIDLKLFTLPCRLFWFLDLVSFLIVAWVFKKFLTTPKE